MTTLAISSAGEVSLTLSGEGEDRILTTVRRWPYWKHATVERDPADATRTLSVTLITDQLYEPMVREILKRSFGMTFPSEGGSADYVPEPVPAQRRGRRR